MCILNEKMTRQCTGRLKMYDDDDDDDNILLLGLDM